MTTNKRPASRNGLRLATIAAGSILATACSLDRQVDVQPPRLIETARADNAAGITAYVGATLIDGTEGDAIANSVVVVENTRITAVGTLDTLQLEDGIRQVNLEGHWIIPGLIDAHVHFFESGRIYTKPRQIDLTHIVSYDEEAAWIRKRAPVTLKRYLCAGVTTAVSMGGPSLEYDFRDIARKTPDAPNVFVAAGPLTLVSPDAVLPRFEGEQATRRVTTETTTAEEVRRAADLSSDLVKTAYLGGPFQQEESNYAAVHGWIVREARRFDLPVTSHVFNLGAAVTLIDAGVNSLQHIPLEPVDDAFISNAIENDIIIVPTLAVLPRNLVDIYTGDIRLTDIERRCGDPEVIESWSTERDLIGALKPADPRIDHIPQAGENVRRLYENGVALAAGSDAGNFGLLHGPSLHYEMQLMAQVGVIPKDILTAASLNAARIAGKDDEIGSVQAGKLADMVVLAADPLTDIKNAQKIVAVIKSGRWTAQDALLP